MRIVADENIPFIKGRFETVAEVLYLPAPLISRASLKDADALIVRSVTQCNEKLLKDTGVKFIATATSGDDHIDNDYCRENGIRWISAKGANATAVEQYVLFFLLHVSVKEKISLRGRTLGIIGVGNIGQRVQKVAEILGMTPLLNDPPRERKEGQSGFTGLPEVLRDSDILTLHVPLIKEGPDKTHHLAADDFFSLSRKGCIFINTSRGEAVKEKSLLNAMRQGKVAASALDVWDNEPEINRALLHSCDLGTPHIAGYSVQGKYRASASVVSAISAFFSLGLDESDVQPLPDAPQPTLKVNGAGKTDEEVALEAVSLASNLYATGRLLKEHPGDFTRLRNAYSYRNENSAFCVELWNTGADTVAMMEQFGFNIK
ncbi:MAG: 4-phosphoerythronate dehydrogenase [Bacteroidales bacterium]|nr:4-phosphoerythronate dehydrogenase [Bacteroidales bacterium]